MDQKILVVVSILTARNFPRRPDCTLLIEARLNGEVLTSDPTTHSSGVVPINTELAWEMTRKAFQQHKLHRTPIKLLVFAVDNNTHARQKVGYVMLDLRSARVSSQSDPSWYGVLNSSYSRLKPQLQVEVSLEDEGPSEGEIQSKENETTAVPISLNLDPSGDFYTLGTPSTDHTMHTLSLTLHNAQHLPSHKSQLYFYYNLLGNDITSELFTPPSFPAERASIRIKSKQELLSLLFAAQQDLEVHLCCGTDSLAKGYLSLGGLGSRDSLNSTIPLGNSEGCPTVDVTVQIEQTNGLTTSHPLTPSSHITPSSQAPSTTTPTKTTVTPLPSAKRNLTHSFEEASQHTPTDSSISDGNSPHPDVPKPPSHTPLSAHKTPPTTSNTSTHPPSPMSTSHLKQVTPPLLAATKGKSTQDSHSPSIQTRTSQTEVPPITNEDDKVTIPYTQVSVQTSSGPGYGVPHQVTSEVTHRFRFSVDLRSIHNLQLNSQQKCYLRYCYPFFGSPYPVLVQPPVLPVVNSDQPFSHSFCSFDFAIQQHRLEQHVTSQPLSVEVWQSCDQSPDLIVGLAQVLLGSVLSHDRTMLEGGVTHQVCSLRVPITPPSQPHTLTLGYLNVVLIMEDFGTIDKDSGGMATQRCLKDGVGENVPGGGGGVSRGVPGGVGGSVPVEVGGGVPGGVGGSVPGGVGGGVPGRVGGGVPGGVGGGMPGGVGGGVPGGVGGGVPGGVGGAVPGGGQPLVGSLEYNTAVELELWKLAQQEEFEERLKSREATHMTKLGEELQRRETQRQSILKQKLDHYSSLERQLQEGLQKLQSQQKTLTERDAKVSQDSERLSRERQLLQEEVQRSQSQFRSQCEHQVEIERLKSTELQSLVASLKKQVRDLEVKVQSREAEFESYRQQTLARPESKLHAELSILQLEKAELDRKLSTLAKSKQHYKEQWTRALAELASCRQKEQAAARERLLTQQRELEAIRMQYVENEHQNSLRQQLSHVKNEVEKLQEHTLSKPHPQEPADTHPHTSPPIHTQTPPLTTSQQDKTLLDSNVARWIEERDILLQTGVYSNTDATIQKLDSKIRQALQQTVP